MLALGKGHRPRPFSQCVFGRLAAQWQDWKNGIPPGREWKGRGGQNPRILAAFETLSSAESRAQAYFREHPPKR